MRQNAKIEVELRILAEDDAHVVIAVCIDKAWAARNMQLLAALGASDQISGAQRAADSG